MSQHARIEELSDSDSDPPEDDVEDFTPSDIIRRASPASKVTSSTNPTLTPQQFLSPQSPAVRGSSLDQVNQPPPDYKTYQCLYPVYFDSNRSRAEGRRVGKEQAVQNPLAQGIMEAVQTLGMKTVFEPAKTHPKDWSNPGRVRVALKQGRSGKVKNKHHLYTLVSAHLKSHPTVPTSPLKLRIHGMPTPEGAPPAPAVPRGWKMNSVLPLHSPAMSGGGVSENMLKDIMAEMQGAGGQGNPMAGLMGGLGAGEDSGAGAGPSGGGVGKRKREGKKR